MVSLRSKLQMPVWMAALVVVSLLAAGTVAAVTVTTLSFNPIEPAQGTVSNSADLDVTGSDVTYSGLTATNVDVTISNSGGTSHNVTVTLEVKDSGGTTQATGLKTASVPGGGSTTLSFSVSVGVSNLSSVEVLVEQTS